MSHPLYPALLTAFIECQKVGAPPEIVGRLSALAGDLDSDPGDRRQDPVPDPELDEFMETYCDVLVRYKQELTRPVQEADQFFRAMEAQMESFTLGICAFVTTTICFSDSEIGNGSADYCRAGNLVHDRLSIYRANANNNHACGSELFLCI
ncbi:unnamed protein product [Triticum turgidum subsp. durum]|uniref:KNOX2 domain-containing protein n=1 Tax=Triticum turgidum subsp. durum TaxID=4567 RepID=A0A9R0SJC0_TRITD|nr:unnamed protein product [Triticum turgidum subsp. durum]